MNKVDESLQADVVAINNLAIVPVILEMICKTTGMGFATIARVTPDKWMAMAVRDEIKFGLVPGGELKVDTTICHEIQQGGMEVVIDHVTVDEFWAAHHTPKMYGFQSYISVPIRRHSDNSFYGTLCAIDPSPALLNTPEIIGMFKTFALLVSFHLNVAERLTATKVDELEACTIAEIKLQLRELQQLFITDGSAGTETEQASARKFADRRSAVFLNTIERASSRIKALIGNLETVSLL